jgi:predicted TIM-barrel fold metal-dependent hydrolase
MKLIDDRVLIVSTDGHVGPTPELVRPYFESGFQSDFADALARLREENAHYVALSGLFALSEAPEVRALIDADGAISSGGETGAYDPARRVAEMDREGVAAEVLIAQHQLAVPPFFAYANRPHPPELRAAGTRAYHRWLADYASVAPHRLLAIAEPGPCLDMEATVRELKWAAAQGFVATHAPGIIADPALPRLFDRHFDAYWSACVELDLPVIFHVSYGRPQGELVDFGAQVLNDLSAREGDLDASAVEALLNAPDSPFGPDLRPRRGLWQLILGGVFDRFPGLRCVTTEIHADWIPATLAVLDRRTRTHGMSLRMDPSEYWRRHCFASVSVLRRVEIEMRAEIGVDHMMFGRDYPHPEGTWPNTWNWIRSGFKGVPEQEARAILGENALQCFGLARDPLWAIARAIGPTPSDLGGDHYVDPELINAFDTRAGYGKPREVLDIEELERQIGQDLVAVTGAQPDRRE